MKSVFAILLITITFLSSVGFSLNKHYCSMTGDVFYSLIGDSDCECDDQKGCPMHQSKKEGCCDDEVEYIQLHENYNTPIDIDFELISIQIPLIYNWLFIQPKNNSSEKNLISTNTSDPPPLVVENIPVFIQSFLI